jgi:glutamine synthetase
MLTLEKLKASIESGEIDTVMLAFADMQGRLQGKLVHGAFFLDSVLEHGTEGCNYLLAVDVDMNTVDGYDITSWKKGYGDMQFALDLDTIRLVPWRPGTAMIQCDLTLVDGGPLDVSPRAMLRAQAEKAAVHGWRAFAGTELEFVIYNNSYEDAWSRGYRDLTPANQYNVDYSILGSSRVEPLLRDVRGAMYEAGLNVESAKGECNLGQHEIAFKYDDVITTADNHVVYKTGAKDIAYQHGQAITFMAKPNEREGNSCHIHMSLRGHARVHAVLRTQHQLVQAVRARVLRPDCGCLGQRQPHVRRPPGRARSERPHGEPAARRRRQSVPVAGRHARRRSVRHRARTRARTRHRGQRLRVGRTGRAHHAARGARRLRRL